MRAFFATLLLALMAQNAVAADRWYEIEVIVFLQKDPNLGAEKWPMLPQEPILDKAVIAPNTIIVPSLPMGALATTTRELLRVAGVPTDQYKLADVMQSLTRSRLYQPLIHTAWRQPVGSGKEQVKVRIAGGKDFSGVYGIDGERLDTGSPPAMEGLFEIDGFVSFHTRNLLYATVEMIHRRAELTPQSISPNAVTANSNLSWQMGTVESSPADAVDRVQFYKMSQQRRVKSGEIQYFDHPVYGVIIEMRPLEPSLEMQLEESHSQG